MKSVFRVLVLAIAVASATTPERLQETPVEAGVKRGIPDYFTPVAGGDKKRSK